MQLKNLFKLAVVVLLLSSCGEENVNKNQREWLEDPEGAAKDQPGVVEKTKAMATIDPSDLRGMYVGMFTASKMDDKKLPMYTNKISVFIDSLVGDNVYGHSVVAGNSRPFKGSVTSREANFWEITVKEPGDNKYDGVFTMRYVPGTNSLIGDWVANDQKLSVTERGYRLRKEQFSYDAGKNLSGNFTEVYTPYSTGESKEYITNAAMEINASVTELKTEDVENMYKRDLEVMRNAIYARHGYSFKNREMRYFFDNYVDWYIPVSTDVTKELTALEKKNITLIKRYEDHATSYYDSFGR